MASTHGTTDRPPLPDRIVRMASLGRLFFEEKQRRPGVVTHAEGVARLAGELAADVGLRGPDLDDLTTAARIHDVGKLDTPDRIYKKPGGLDADEFATMRTHARDGAVRLRERGLPAIFVDVARFHHERYDGLGYEGRGGESIPYSARIVHVCDVYDAMREKRDYKPAIPHGVILGIMTAEPKPDDPGRRKYDPVLLRRFVALRLKDPSTVLTRDERAGLEAFVGTNPNADIEAGAPARFAADEGARTGRPDPRAALLHAGPDLHADIDREIGVETPVAGWEDVDDEAPAFRM